MPVLLLRGKEGLPFLRGALLSGILYDRILPGSMVLSCGKSLHGILPGACLRGAVVSRLVRVLELGLAAPFLHAPLVRGKTIRLPAAGRRVVEGDPAVRKGIVGSSCRLLCPVPGSTALIGPAVRGTACGVRKGICGPIAVDARKFLPVFFRSTFLHAFKALGGSAVRAFCPIHIFFRRLPGSGLSRAFRIGILQTFFTVHSLPCAFRLIFLQTVRVLSRAFRVTVRQAVRFRVPAGVFRILQTVRFRIKPAVSGFLRGNEAVLFLLARERISQDDLKRLLLGAVFRIAVVHAGRHLPGDVSGPQSSV